MVRQDPEFAERVRSESVYRHAGRYCKWAVVTFVLGVVVLVAFFAKTPVVGFIGVVIMFASAVVFERNLRRMGRAGWHDLTRPRDGEQSKASAASSGFEGAVTEARDWFRTRFHRRELTSPAGSAAALALAVRERLRGRVGFVSELSL